MKPLFGFRNMGNTCYINSVLQCLRHNDELIKYLLSEKLNIDVNRKLKKNKIEKKELILIQSFGNILKQTMSGNVARIVRPLSFIKKFDNEFSQIALNPQDAHEALNFLLDNFHENISRSVKIEKVSNISSDSADNWKSFYEKNYSNIIDIFFGQMKTKTQCINCKDISNSYAPFNDLQLDLYPNIINSIKAYFSGEEVEKRCEKCSPDENVKMIKSSLISIPPLHLIVQVKRFQFTERGLIKKNQSIEIPELLDLTDFYDYPNRYAIYTLYAGIIHLGSPHFGHYISFCKNGDFWFKYDDETVTKINSNELQSLKQNSYILFFKKN